MPKTNEHVRFGLKVNPNKENNAKQPDLFAWMMKLNTDEFVEGSTGALWLNVGEKCPEDKSPKAREFISTFTRALGMGWIKATGNLEVQALYDALGAHGPDGGSTNGNENDPF